MKQMALDIGLAAEPTLSSFLGAANQAVRSRLDALLAGPGGRGLPLYIWGGAGTGKSHLLRATRAALTGAGATVGWLDSQAGQGACFDPSWTAVFIDDVHLLGPQLQHVAFNWLIHALAADAGACMVFAAGAVPPTDLPVRADLSSRLAWGDVFELHLPTDAERRAALHASALARGLTLSEQVSSYLLTHFTRDLGSQMQLLDQLDRYALQEQRVLSVPLIKDMLRATAVVAGD
ncbi:MAG: DnaA regulatory inactivator Hda [Ottowia sp.]|nr:DnaA regulatory inactivator Hda [Ottowia sp.]